MIQGDSGEVLGNVLPNITEPCLLWLDAHYSEALAAKGRIETPIVHELQHALRYPVAGHLILIDDARCFVGRNDHPTIEALREVVVRTCPGWVLEVEHDIIRIHGWRTAAEA